jgi:hypothetical protein
VLKHIVVPGKKKKGRVIRPGFEEEMAKQLQRKIGLLSGELTDEAS